MMTVPRYRHLPFGDMSALILDPLIRDRIAIATAAKDGEAADGTLAGVAIWASVTPRSSTRSRPVPFPCACSRTTGRVVIFRGCLM